MTSEATNELLTRVGPGSALHDVMRRYWVPCVRAAKLEAGGAPELVVMLGRRYVAFRAEDGRVGLFDEACPHRGVSLTLARNEDCALRCLYHGWKIDVGGAVVETPSEPADRTGFRDKVSVGHYPTHESGGLLWAWLGDGDPPPFPELEFGTLDDDHRWLRGIPVNANWLQVLEGNFDAAHAGVLHATSNVQRGGFTYLTADSAPEWKLTQQPWGLSAAAIRTLDDRSYYRRENHYVFPFVALVAGGDDDERMAVVVLPNDDEHTMQWVLWYHPSRPMADDAFGAWYFSKLDPDPDDGRRSIRADDRWGQDRHAMRWGSFSGLRGVAIEDVAVVESQGPIVDRAREHLGSSDQGVIALRRTVLDALKRDHPPSLDGIDFSAIRATSQIVTDNDLQPAKD